MNIGRLRHRLRVLDRRARSLTSEVHGLRTRTYDLPLAVVVAAAARRVGVFDCTAEEAVDAMADEIEGLRRERRGAREAGEPVTSEERQAIRARFEHLRIRDGMLLNERTFNPIFDAIADLAVDVAALESRLAVERSKWCHNCGAPWDWAQPRCRFCDVSRPVNA